MTIVATQVSAANRAVKTIWRVRFSVDKIITPFQMPYYYNPKNFLIKYTDLKKMIGTDIKRSISFTIISTRIASH